MACSLWLQQFTALVRKNFFLALRQRIQFVILLLGPLIFVFLTWAIYEAAGGDLTEAQLQAIEFDSCGSASATMQFNETTWYEYDYETDRSTSGDFPNSEDWVDQVSLHNKIWSTGVGTWFLMFGPLFFVVIVMNLVTYEARIQMLGQLRATGMKESVYWASWFVFFTGMAFCNSMLATIGTKALPVHVFQQTAFGAIFLSFWILQVSLSAMGCLFATLVGKNSKLASFVYVLLFVAVTTMVLMLSLRMHFVYFFGAFGADTDYQPGAYWQYGSTETCNETRDIYRFIENGEFCDPAIFGSTCTSDPYDYYSFSCTQTNCSFAGFECLGTGQRPLVATNDVNSAAEEDYFLGCFVVASAYDAAWDKSEGLSSLFLFAMYITPFYHFGKQWSLFLGATQLPGGEFTMDMLGMEVNEVIAASNPYDLSYNTNGFPSGSLLEPGTPIITGRETRDTQRNDNCLSLSGSGISDTSLCGWVEALSTSGPSYIATSFSLLFIALVYYLLNMYLAQVLTRGNGVSKSILFPFKISYWKPAAAVNSETKFKGVTLQGLHKVFGSFTAVSGFSMELKESEIYCLLGHNGAGKSTLIKMLTGDLQPTAGDAEVYGYSVVKELSMSRELIGLCPQHDILYDNLTALDHLRLFASLRGLNKTVLESQVTEWLEDVNLQDVATNYSSSYSGGMKRRLSLAMSTIGDTKVIVLDEPTTGMDPINRRFAWRHVEKIKKDRVVLLTTHAMDEADLLADTVAIMHSGSLVELGSPLELKQKFGSGVRFQILVDKSNTSQAVENIKEVLGYEESDPDLTITSGAWGDIVVNLKDLSNSSRLQGFLKYVQEPDNGIAEFGISNSTLDEIFMKVTDTAENRKSAELAVAVDDVLDVTLPVAQAAGLNDDISSAKSSIKTLSQVKAVIFKEVRRHWTGRWSLINYLALLFFAGMCWVVAFTAYVDPTSIFQVSVSVMLAMLSLPIVLFIHPLVSETQSGVFSLQKTQGLMARSFLISQTVYIFVIMLLFQLVTFFFVSVSPLYSARICLDNELEYQDQCLRGSEFGIYTFLDPNPPLVGPDEKTSVVAVSVVFIVFPLFKGPRLAVFASGVLLFAVGFTVPFGLTLMLLNKKIDTDSACTDEVSRCSKLIASFGNSTPTFGPDDLISCLTVFELIEVEASLICAPATMALFPPFGFSLSLFTFLVKRFQILIETDVAYQTSLMSIINSNSDNVKCLESGGVADGVCSNPFVDERYNAFLGYTLVGSVLFFVFSVVLIYVLKFPPEWFIKLKKALLCKVLRNEHLYASDDNEEEIDVDVKEETKYVEQFDADGNNKEFPPILLQKLRKVYPSRGGLPPKVACKSLDLHVEKGQVLGLLGPNGAGKTTAIKVIAGTHRATSGKAFICSNDVDEQPLRVFENLGNCPQFEVIWPAMTVRRHLTFYARLKGLPSSKIGHLCRELAKVVGLYDNNVYYRKAKHLSGGMRRRLSIGIALLGAPDIVLLDEPTTGLDPKTRHNIWDLIRKFSTPERSFIITTHMMTEADILCDRIAIMARGTLRVVGSQQRLKDRFGNGYTLVLTVIDGRADSAFNYVKEYVHSGAKIEFQSGKTMRVTLPSEGMELGRVFSELSSKAAAENGISQWIINQSSLEDVFVNVAENAL